MAKNVLILATRYDAASARTYQWAEDLQRQLFRYADACMLVDASTLCAAGSSLNNLIQQSNYVVFYGHGEKDRWLALPGTGASSTLIDDKSVSLLKGRSVYAGCCSSLAVLGPEFKKKCPGGEFIGYDDRFGFDDDNEYEFRRTANQSVVNFVDGTLVTRVVSELRQEWTSLSQSFTLGHLRKRLNGVQAGHLADLNSQRIGTP